MTLAGRLVALVAGTAAATSIGWTAVQRPAVRPQKPNPAARAAASADDIVVCAGTDGVLRSADAGGCGAGLKRVKLDHAETQVSDCDDCTAWSPLKPTPAVDDPLAGLEDRVDRLHKSPLFTVVDKSGNPIFAVGPERTTMSRGNQPFARIDADEDGGMYTARTPAGGMTATFGVEGSHAGLAVSSFGRTGIDLGRQSAGNYALKIQPSATGAAAAIGESQAGTGAIVIGDALGRPRARMEVDPDGGSAALSIINIGGGVMASLRQSEAGAGHLSLGNSSGREAVKMVVNDNRYGVVITGPVVGFPLVSGSGLPGSYILGCAAGPSCRQ
jgi:hypothetical protein